MLILLLAMAGGVVGPLLTGGMTGLLRDLVAPTEVDRAYRLEMVYYNAAGICGPALAAIIAGWMNAEVAMFALAGGAGVAAAIVLTLPIPDRQADTSASTEPLTRAFSQGIGVFLKDHLLRSVTIASCLGQLGMGATPLAIVLIATEHYSASTAGILLSASAVGGLVGSLAYARVPVGSGTPERVVLACLAGAVPPFCVLAYDAGSLIPTALLWTIVGVLSGPLGSSLFVIRDRQAPPSIHTQVFTTGAGLKITSAAGGSAAAGMLAGFGASWLLVIIALFHLVAAITGAVLLKHTR